MYNGGARPISGRLVAVQLFPHADHVSDAKIIGRGAFEPESTGESTGVAPHFGDASRRQRSSARKQTEAGGPRKFGERDGLSTPRQARAHQTELLRYKPPHQRSHFGGGR